MKIYKTNNIEDSIRKLSENHKRTVILLKNHSARYVRPVLNKVKDINSVLIRDWTNDKSRLKDDWNGLIYYRHHPSFLDLPESQALLMIDCPLSINQFDRYVKHDSNMEVVVYVPPDWSMQYDHLNDINPCLKDYQELKKSLKEFRGIKYNERIAEAKYLAKWDYSAAFTAKQFFDLTGIKEIKLRHMLKAGYWKEYIRFHPYKAVIDPQNHLSPMFKLLMDEPIENSFKLLRSNELSRCYEYGNINNRVPGFKSALIQMVKDKNVIQYDCIYVVNKRNASNDHLSLKHSTNANYFEQIKTIIDSSENHL
jgi:hypothetical protein